MPREQDFPELRRDLTPKARDVVQAAKTEFAAHGFAGATTDAIARRADVSQPYVVRLFGSKERLFMRCCQEAQEAMMAKLRSAASSPDKKACGFALEAAYYDIVASDPDTVELMIQQYGMGQHPTLGPWVREWFMQLYDVLRHEVGLDAKTAADYLARGVAINVALGLRLRGTSQDSADLLSSLRVSGHEIECGDKVPHDA